jgi:hypothetical protein
MCSRLGLIVKARFPDIREIRYSTPCFHYLNDHSPTSRLKQAVTPLGSHFNLAAE